MSRSIRRLALLSILVLVVPGAVGAEDPPRLLATNPVDGSRGVPVDLAGVLFVFDRPMDVESRSLVRSDRADFPPIVGEGDWLNERTFFLRVKDLRSDHDYAIGLNGPHHGGFRSVGGVSMSPAVVAFRTAGAGAASPVVVGTEPNPGSTDVDPGLSRVVVHFSEDVKAGRMSLLRLAGVEKLGYLPEKRPYFENPRTLVIPVRLSPGTAYGVAVNGPGHEGFVSVSGERPVLPFHLAFTTGAEAAPPTATGPVGSWVARAPEGEIAIDLRADGTYRYRSREGATEETAEGTWRIDGERLVIRQTGAAEPLLVPYRMTSREALELNVDGSWVRFARAGAERKAPPPAPGLAGTWRWCEGDSEILLVLRADGRYSYRGSFPEGKEEAEGRWKVEGGSLVVTEDGAAAPLRVPFSREGAALVIELGGDRYRLARQEEGAPPPEPARPGATGEIFFVRYESSSVEIGGRKVERPIPKLYRMNPDGSGIATLSDRVDADVSIQEPSWAPDGKSYVFAADMDRGGSALMMDAWRHDLTRDETRRITGNGNIVRSTGKVGTIALVLTDDTDGGDKTITWWCQGAGGKVIEGAAKGHSTVENVPAGKLWIKCFYDRHRGDMQVVDVPAGGVANVELKLSRGNRYATYPSITPDGKTIVCLSQHAYWDRTKPKQPEQGFDTMAAVDVESGQLVALWNPTEHGGAFAKDPRLSPDGKWIAFAMGLPGMESLAVCSLESFLAGKAEPKVLVPGNRELARGTWGNVAPAWSPDGTRISFTRYFMSTSIRGNLMVVPAAGGPARQVTNLDANQCPTYPCWSPDGKRIAFQLVTGRGPVLDILDLIQVNFASDVAVVGADGSGLRRLTNDGRSGQPAWKP